MRKAAFGFIYLTFVISAALYAQNVTIAVLNFTNLTKVEELDPLSLSLPETISATLSQLKDIQVVEREHMDKMLRGIELELSGDVNDLEASRAGALLSADVLVLGSISGSRRKIVLTLKAVETETARIIYGWTATGSLDEIYEIANMAALLLGSVAAGKDTGTLLVISDPADCDIYVDGLLVGRSPLIEYRLPTGSHRVQVIKAGYHERDILIDVVKDETSRWEPALPESHGQRAWTVFAGAMYLYPLTLESEEMPVEPSLLGLGSFGYSFDRLTITGEYTYSRPDHREEISFFDTIVVPERWYRFQSVRIAIIFAPWRWRALSPYFGISGGGSTLSDFRENAAFEAGREPLIYQSRFLLGARAGVKFLPFFPVQPVLEARFYYHPEPVIRTAFESRGLAGGLAGRETKYTFFGFTLGGGLRIKF